MTISTQLNKITYNGDGSTTQWTFSFPGQSVGAILVYVTDSQGNVVQQSAVNYSVSLNAPIAPNPTSVGGTVVFPLSGTPLAPGNKLTIRRLLPMTQQTSFPNQSVIYPPIVETDDDYLTMVDQQLQEQIGRSIMVNISDPPPAPLPPIALRANQQAFFDAQGNLTGGQFSGSGVVVSAAMQPVVSAATLKAAQIAMGFGPFGYGALSGNKVLISSANTLNNTMKGATIVLTGNALYTFTVPAADASIDDDFQVLIYVNDNRGKRISVPGYPDSPFMLWPGQWMIVSKISGTWLILKPPRWKVSGTIPFYVNPTTGNDTNDGLARGSGAFSTIQGAVNAVQRFTDGNFNIIPEAGAFSHPVGSGVVVDGLQFNRSITIIGDGPVAPPGVGVYCDTGGVVFTAKNGAILGLQNLFISPSPGGASAEGILMENGGVVNLFNCSFGGFNGPHMEVFENATLNLGGFYDIYAGATLHLYVHGSGYVTYGATTVGFTTGMSIGTFMEVVYNSSIIFAPGVTFANPGFCSGDKVFVDYNSTIVTQGATIPGTTPGTIGTHGGYVV